MSNFNLQTSHPLIQSEQTFVLDRKVISVHSIDRDYKKWPNSNNFGIDLGEAFHNVQSLRLIDYSIPLNNYTFSTSYQNTKMSFNYTTKLKFSFAADNDTPVFNDKNGSTFSNNKTFIDEVMYKLFPAPNTGYWFKEIPSDIKVMVKQSDGSFKQVTTTSSLFSAITPAPPITNMDNTDMQVEIIWKPSSFKINLPEGSYTAENLAKTIESLMNKAVFNASADLSHNMFPLTGKSDNTFDYTGLMLEHTDTNSVFYRKPNDPSNYGLNPFVVKYDKISNKIIIGSTQGEFTLNFANQEIYDPTCDVNKAIFHQYTKWGLPSYLGFDKDDVSGASTDISSNTDFYIKNVGGLFLHSDIDSPWLQPSGINEIICSGANNATFKSNSIVRSVSATNNLDINGEDAIYIEVDRYNNIDEIYPYSERTGHLYNNDLGHRVNGSFAKVSLPSKNDFSNGRGFQQTTNTNLFHSDPPILRIDRLKFKFRYHDGRLVDFKNLPISLTFEFNMLKDEQSRGKFVRIPHLYGL